MAKFNDYTLAQLRGAYVAGKRDAGAESKGEDHPERVRHCIDWSAGELIALTQKHGPAMAFSRQSESHQWARCVIVNIRNVAGPGGWEATCDAVFEEVERRLIATHGNTPDVSYALQCLEYRFEDVASAIAFLRESNVELSTERNPDAAS
jgi:hypothetical protein